MKNDPRDEFIRRFFQEQHSIAEFVRYLVPHCQDAEDVFQELAVIVMKKTASELPAVDQCGVYCRGIARNLARQYWRGKKTQKVVFSDELCDALELAYAEAEAEPEIWAARRRALDFCIEQLPEPSRALLREHYLSGVRIVDIAARMNRSADALRVMLMRIRTTLHDCVDRHAQQMGVA
jgi:RNA polymerase sigma-70 factor (ECF subfamily)